MTSDGAAPFQHTRVVRGGLKWSAVRGALLLEAITPISCHQEEGEEGDQETENDRRQGPEFPYELELCVPTAGHLALVLVRSTLEAPLNPPVNDGHTTTSATATTPAPADPRVVYVLDALPPSRWGPRNDKKWRRTSTLGAQSPLQHVDELELLQELFAPHTRAAGGKEGSVLVKAPLLCARFDCRVVSIQFIRSAGNYYQLPRTSRRRGDIKGRCNASASSDSSSSSSRGATTSSRVVNTAAPLRCVVAREDGMAFLWEWQADLFQWVFLNKLCFLENPNLKWTRPVVAFTTSDLPLNCKMSSLSLNIRGGNGNESGSSGATEFIWWSRATKHEPKLKIRRLRFERATDALRATDVVVGNAFIPKSFCNDVVELLSSKLGLFVISRSQGVFFRSSISSLETVTLNWHKIFSLDEASLAPEMSQIIVCLHSVTGELVILHRESGGIYIVTPKSPNTSAISRSDTHENESCTFLFARRITTLTPWKQSSSATLGNDDQAFDVRDVVAHRHVFLLLTCSVLHVYTLITGELLEIVSLPDVLAHSPQQRGGEKCKFWTISGGASSVGLWAPRGFWTVRLPPATTVATALRQPQSAKQKDKREFPDASFLAVKDYGIGNSHWDAVRYGLDILARLTPSAMNPTHIYPEVWETVWNAVSSPALVLALLDNRAESEHIVRELTRHVALIHAAASSIRSPEGMNDPIAPSTNENPFLRLTPANVESLHHLSNWIVLAKRKLACLETAGGNLLSSPIAESSDRCKSTHPYPAMTELTAVLANKDDLSITHDRQHSIQRKDSILNPEDTRNFRLSRKLRPMSSLRFAGGCSTSSEQQGRQRLLQLESFLLDGVAFKNEHRSSGTRRVIRAETAPSHRLFHSERVLSDFRHVAASSFSKHMYLESMSRLYVLYEPESLLPFIRCVDRFCPRLFSLTGHQSVSRSHAERALTLFPPLKFFTHKVIRAKERGDEQVARSSLLAYADLLSYCGCHSEACRALLECHLYEESKRKLLLLLKDLKGTANSGDDGQKAKVRTRVTASRAVYFLILDYCTSHCSSTELNVVLMLKPAHVDVIHVLRALRTALSCSKYQRQQSKDGGACSTGLTVGNLRSVLANLMQQRCIGMSK